MLKVVKVMLRNVEKLLTIVKVWSVDVTKIQDYILRIHYMFIWVHAHYSVSSIRTTG